METNEEIYVKVFLIEDYKNKEKNLPIFNLYGSW